MDRVTAANFIPLVSGAVNITDTANDIEHPGHRWRLHGVYVFGGVGAGTTPAVTINNAGTTVQVGADANTTCGGIHGHREVAAPTGSVVVNDGTSAAAPNQAYDNIANIEDHDVTVVGATVTDVTVTPMRAACDRRCDAYAERQRCGADWRISVVDTAGAVNPNSTTIAGVGDPARGFCRRLRRDDGDVACDRRRCPSGHCGRLGQHGADGRGECHRGGDRNWRAGR